MNNPIAYTYETDTHCPHCCKARFGDDYGDNTDTVDNEGNPIGVIYGFDQWYDIGQGNQTLGCGTCYQEIAQYHEE